MGAAWMTLAFFIDRRESFVQRFLKVTGVSLVLFFPTTFLPEISYLSHFLGYIFGVLTGIFVYLVFHKTFNKAEIIEEINEDEEVFDWEHFSVDNLIFKPMESHDLEMFHEWLKREHVAKNWRGVISANPYIVYHNEKPLGFIQSYNASNFPDGVLGIDQFIAEKKLLGKGLGSSFIKKFSDELLQKENVNLIISEPSSLNKPAIRAYRKAGFRRLENLTTQNGVVALMAKKKEESLPSFYH
jgi:RimJ/RimL family protein N-acetyltransferase